MILIPLTPLTAEDIDFLAKKVLSLKLFEDEQGKMWSESVVTKGFEILSVC